MRAITRLFRADSPLGPTAAGALTVTVFLIAMAFLLPPTFWLLGKVLGPWWAYWRGW